MGSFFAEFIAVTEIKNATRGIVATFDGYGAHHARARGAPCEDVREAHAVPGAARALCALRSALPGAVPGAVSPRIGDPEYLPALVAQSRLAAAPVFAVSSERSLATTKTWHTNLGVTPGKVSLSTFMSF